MTSRKTTLSAGRCFNSEMFNLPLLTRAAVQNIPFYFEDFEDFSFKTSVVSTFASASTSA